MPHFTLARVAHSMAAPMQSPFDAMAKALIDAALEGVCDVSLQEPVTPDTLYSDAVIDPRAPTDEIVARGLLGRMASVACVIEAFATVPTVYDADRCVARTALLRANQRRERVLWMVSPGRARSVIDAFALGPDRAWPRGVYLGNTSRVPRLIVASELTRSRSTLLLRLMGRGAVLRAAIEETTRLSDDAWERPFVTRILLHMRTELRRMTGDDAFSKEIEMRYAEYVKSVDKLIEDLETRGEARGEARGELIGERRALVTLLTARGIAVDEGIAARITACDDREQLVRWIARAATAQSIDAVFE